MSHPHSISRTIDDEGVVTLHFQDEVGKNALSETFVELFLEHLAAIAEDPRAKVCLIKGLPGIFCSGGDIAMLRNLAEGKVQATDIMLSRALLELPIPTIAAMAGHAIGGGLTLGLCCDMILLGEQSRYGCTFRFNNKATNSAVVFFKCFGDPFICSA